MQPLIINRLEAKISLPETDNHPITAIICHPHPLFGGTMNNKVVTTLARTFNDLGLTSVTFNFRGVGKSEGHYDAGRGETDDVLSIVKWVRETRPADKIWLAGFSFGAYVAYRAASLTEIAKLVLVAPPVNHFDFESLLLPTCSWIVVQGDRDEVVSPERVFSWIEHLASPPQLIRMEGVTHFFHGALIKLQENLIKLLSSEVG